MSFRAICGLGLITTLTHPSTRTKVALGSGAGRGFASVQKSGLTLHSRGTGR